MSPQPVNLLGHFHLYPPSHNAGAEWMVHSMLRSLQAHGAKVRVVTSRPPRRRGSFEGIPVEMVANPARASLDYRWADVAMTHLDVTRQSMRLARRHRVPLVHVIHNHQQLEYHRVTPADAALVVWNSRWVAERAGAGWDGDTMIVLPPVPVSRFEDIVPPDDGAVTLLNLAEAKGAHLFYELARRMPDVQFLGVRGSYGEQVEPPDLPNLTVLPNQPDVRKVYERTRVLLMPSTYESFGRCAVEAAAAGIPSVGSDAAGLVEAGCNWANLPLDIEQRPAINGFARASALGSRRTADLWETAVRELCDDAHSWFSASLQAHDRAVELEATTNRQLADLALRIEGLRP